MQTLENLKTKLSQFSLTNSDLNKLWAHQDNGKIRLFCLLDILISNRYIDKGNTKNIIADLCRMHLDFYQKSDYKNLEDLGKTHNITRERVRQIKDKFKTDFNRKFSFLRDIEFIEEVPIDISAQLVEISQDLTIEINTRNGTDFSSKFIARIYGVLESSTHYYVGVDETSSWISGYLISKEMDFEFTDAINNFRNQLKPYPIRKQEEIFPYHKFGLASERKVEIEVLKKLISCEFKEINLTDSGLILPRTKTPNREDYVVVALEKLGPVRTGHHLGTIISAMGTDGEQYQPESIRASLQDSRFTALGRKSTYILTDWLDDQELGIIPGDYIRLGQGILEKEILPLSLDDLIEKIADHRINPKSQSIKNRLRDCKTIFTVKESFIGLIEIPEHMNFLEAVKRIPKSYFSREEWLRLRNDGVDVSAYFQKNGLNMQQIQYLVQYMSTLIPELNKNSVISLRPNLFSERERNRLLDLLEKFDSEAQDNYARTKVRREHIILKKLLFNGSIEMECSICNRRFPIRLLAVAHIKRRSMASRKERKDPAIVMAACYLGCDALYEKGYVSITDSGQIVSLDRNTNSQEISMHIAQLVGKPCRIYNVANSDYFAHHYEFHSSRRIKDN